MPFILESKAALPAEIWLLIEKYLSRRESKALSLTSKFLRKIFLPFIFHSLQLTRQSIASFEHGEFSPIIPRIQNVIFADLQIPSISDMVDSIILYCSSLSIFPNIRGIQISFPASEEVHAVILAGIFRRISTCSWYSSLDSLVIKIQTTSPHEPSPQRFRDLLPLCSEEAWDFFPDVTDLADLADRDQDELITFDRLGDTFTPPSRLSRVAIVFADGESKVFSNNGPFLPLLHHSRDTLKRVHIATEALCSYYPYSIDNQNMIPRTSFPAVEDVWLTLDVDPELYGGAYFQLRDRFPNIRNLRIDEKPTSRSTEDQVVLLYCMYLLVHLKTARLPWQRVSESGEVLPAESWRGQVEDGLRSLNTGWEDLESLTFINPEIRRVQGDGGARWEQERCKMDVMRSEDGEQNVEAHSGWEPFSPADSRCDEMIRGLVLDY